MIKELQKKLLDKDTYNEQMIEALKRYIREQQKEIEDLKEQVEYQDQWRKEYLERIQKAIEYIEIEKEAYLKGIENYKRIGIKDYADGQLVACKNIEDILKGGKDNE